MELWVLAWYAPRASTAALATTLSAPSGPSDPAAQDSAQSETPGARFRQPYQYPRGLFWAPPGDTSAPAALDAGATAGIPGQGFTAPYRVPRGLWWPQPFESPAPPASYVDGQGLWTLAFYRPTASLAALQPLLFGHPTDPEIVVASFETLTTPIPGLRLSQPYRVPRGEFWRLPLDDSAIIVPEVDVLGRVPGLRFRQPYRPVRPLLPFTLLSPDGVEAGEGVSLWIVPNWTPRLSRAALGTVLGHLGEIEPPPPSFETVQQAIAGARLRQPYVFPRLFYLQNRPALDDSIPPPVTGGSIYVPILRRRRR